MADLVAPGVWWLHRTRGSNVYLVEAADGQLALVDTGFGANTGAILDEVASVANGRPLARILLTHSHFDHIGAALELRRRTGALVVAGLGDCIPSAGGTFAIAPATGRSHMARFVSRWLFRRRPASLPVDFAIDSESEVLPGIVAVPTPGHTPGSVCYIAAAARTAFVGDMVISHARRLSRPMALANADDDLYGRTLAEFALRAPDAGCPGHGQPLESGFGEAIQELAARSRRPRSIGGIRRRAARMRTFLRHMYRRRMPPRNP